MRQPRPPISLLAALLLLLSFSTPSRALTCGSIKASDIEYDISELAGLRKVSKETETPPTRSEARVTMDICNGLAPEDGVASEDQCPVGTRVCLKMINTKNDQERVISVIPIWGKETPDEKIWTTPMGSKGHEGLKVWVEGGTYAGVQQDLNLTLLCSETHNNDPTFVAYVPGRLSLEWSSSHACPRNQGGGSNDGGGGSGGSSGGGMGFWGFLRLLFWLFVGGLIAYFAIGIFYNHQQYSARGWDLLPHRDFWREFPTLLSDLFGHVFANVRGGGGGSRGGYSSLG